MEGEAQAPAPAGGAGRGLWIAIAVVIIAVVVVVAAIFAAPLLFQPAASVKVGTILPITGALSDFGSRMQNAANLAMGEINDAGGIIGLPLELIHEDSQTRPIAGANVATKLVATDGVGAIVGAASSGVSQAVSSVTLENNVVQISPASTSPFFTLFEIERHESLVAGGFLSPDDPVPDTFGNPGWWWRTAPSDALQGKAAAMIANGDFLPFGGWDNMGIIAVNNPYGKGFASAFRGGYTGTVVAQVNYTEEQADYTSDLQLLASANPDAVLMIAYPEDGITMYKNWLANPAWAWDWQWSEGLKSTDFLDDLDTEGVETDGFVGTSPLPPAGASFDYFVTRMDEVFGESLFPFDPHTYDAVYLIALAIELGGAADGTTIRDNLYAVSSPAGTKIFPGEFAKAKTEIAAGRQIDYEGASGSLNFDLWGEAGSDYEFFSILADAFVQEDVITQDKLEAPPAPVSQAQPSFIVSLQAAAARS